MVLSQGKRLFVVGEKHTNDIRRLCLSRPKSWPGDQAVDQDLIESCSYNTLQHTLKHTHTSELPEHKHNNPPLSDWAISHRTLQLPTCQGWPFARCAYIVIKSYASNTIQGKPTTHTHTL